MAGIQTSLTAILIMLFLVDPSAAGDVHVFCGEFVESKDSRCTCAVDKVEADSSKCSFSPSGGAVIISLTKAGVTRKLCEYSNYTTGKLTFNDISTVCSPPSVNSSIYTLVVTVTGNRSVYEGATVDCRPSCINAGFQYGLSNTYGGIPISFITTTTTAATTTEGKPTPPPPGCCCLLCLILLLLLLLPIPVPLPWPGFPIYVLICWFIFKCTAKPKPPQPSPPTEPSLGPQPSSPPPPPPTTCWHTLHMCCKRIDSVYFSSCCVTNDGCDVLIWAYSPVGKFVWYGTEPAGSTNSVSPGSSAVGNDNDHSNQEKKTKHARTEGRPRKSRHPGAPVELTTVRTSSPPEAATIHGDNQASDTPLGDDHQPATPRLRPLPQPSGMTSVERNSSVEYSNVLGRDKHPKLPPIEKSNNHP